RITLLYKLIPYTTLFRSIREALDNSSSDDGARIVDKKVMRDASTIQAGTCAWFYRTHRVDKLLAGRQGSRCGVGGLRAVPIVAQDRKSTRLNSSHVSISY